MAQISDAAFESLFDSCQEAYEQADRYWMPDPQPTPYKCLFADYYERALELDDGGKAMSIEAVFRILEGQLADRVFRLRFNTKTPGAVGALRSFFESMLKAEELGLAPTGNIKTDREAVAALAGRALCSIITKRSKPGKDGKQYTNGYVTAVEGLLDEVPADTEAMPT